MNGLYMPDAYIIPTVPDHLSTYGILQLVDRVQRFTGRSQRRISLLGIVSSKFQNNSKVHQSVRAQLETSAKLPVFKGYDPAIEPVCGHRRIRHNKTDVTSDNLR